MDRNQAIIDLAEQMGILRPRDVEARGIPREYLLRLACVARPGRYARSFFGLVDLLAILPTFAGLLVPGTQALVVIRTVRNPQPDHINVRLREGRGTKRHLRGWVNPWPRFPIRKGGE